MLILKPNAHKQTIYLGKSKGKVTFDPDTIKPEEYQYYKDLGFNQFDNDLSWLERMYTQISLYIKNKNE